MTDQDNNDSYRGYSNDHESRENEKMSDFRQNRQDFDSHAALGTNSGARSDTATDRDTAGRRETDTDRDRKIRAGRLNRQEGAEEVGKKEVDAEETALGTGLDTQADTEMRADTEETQPDTERDIERDIEMDRSTKSGIEPDIKAGTSSDFDQGWQFADKLKQKSSRAPKGQKYFSGALTVREHPRILAVANQKGGVGKTTTAINLSTALAAVGKKVLLVDLDPQGNASTGLGIRRSSIEQSMYDVLFGEADLQNVAMKTRVPNLSVAPSSIHLSGAEIELVTAKKREFRLSTAMRTDLPYDYIIMDCPPSLNLLTLNALIAAHSIVVPLQCEFYALEGLSHLVKTIERVRKHYNPRLDIHGVLLTMFDKRNNLSGMVASDVREYFGDKVYKTVIPRNVRVSEAPSHGLPAIVYDMKCPGSQAYIHLAREVIRRERDVQKKQAA